MKHFGIAENRLKDAFQELMQLTSGSERIDKLDAKSLYHLCKDYTTLYESKTL